MKNLSVKSIEYSYPIPKKYADSLNSITKRSKLGIIEDWEISKLTSFMDIKNSEIIFKLPSENIKAVLEYCEDYISRKIKYYNIISKSIKEKDDFVYLGYNPFPVDKNISLTIRTQNIALLHFNKVIKDSWEKFKNDSIIIRVPFGYNATAMMGIKDISNITEDRFQVTFERIVIL